MAPTNAAATGAWTLQTRNNARQGRALLQTMFESVNSGGANPVPLTSARSGVICTSDFGTDIFDLRVTVTSGLTMSVKPGAALINRSGTGPYMGWLLPGAVAIASDTAPASNPRNDIVVMRIYDAAQGDTVPGTGPCQIEVITGTPGAVPVDPPITGLANGGVCLALARAQVSTSGVITLTDLRKSTSLLGSVRPMLPGDALGDGENLGGSLRWDPVNSNLAVWQGNGGVWQPVSIGASMPRGWVGGLSSIVDKNVTGTELVIDSYTIAAVINRRYEIIADGEYYQKTGTLGTNMSLKTRIISGSTPTATAGTVVKGKYPNTPTGAYFLTLPFSLIGYWVAPSTGTFAVSLTAKIDSGTGGIAGGASDHIRDLSAKDAGI